MRILLVFIPIFLRVTVSAQSPPEDKNLLHYFSNGELSGQIRDFTMSTINAGELDDYYANAIGASIHYETLPFKGFSVALNGIFVYRVFSNDILAIDTIAQDHSQYELQLFNIKDKYFARFIYSKKIFLHLLKRYGFEKKEAKSFLN